MRSLLTPLILTLSFTTQAQYDLDYLLDTCSNSVISLYGITPNSVRIKYAITRPDTAADPTPVWLQLFHEDTLRYESFILESQVLPITIQDLPAGGPVVITAKLSVGTFPEAPDTQVVVPTSTITQIWAPVTLTVHPLQYQWLDDHYLVFVSVTAPRYGFPDGSNCFEFMSDLHIRVTDAEYGILSAADFTQANEEDDSYDYSFIWYGPPLIETVEVSAWITMTDYGPGSPNFQTTVISVADGSISTLSNLSIGDLSTYVPQGLEKPELSAFPNPADTEFRMSGLGESVNYDVANSLGQIVAATGSGSHIDCRLWPSGTYVLRTEDGQHIRLIRK